MRPARSFLAAVVLAAGLTTGCTTLTELLAGHPLPAGQPPSNLLRNPSFERHPSSSKGVATYWTVSPGSPAIAASISKDARDGDASQRIDVLVVDPDRGDRGVGIAPSRRPRLKGNTQYEINAWVKGRGTASLSVRLNDRAFEALGSKVVLNDTWQQLQMVFTTPSWVRNVREIIRFGDGGMADGDWLLVDEVELRASVPRLGSLSREAIASIAERNAAGSTPGAKVVAAALALVKNGTVVKGGCWDWVNRAYDDAGYPAKKRQTVFQSRLEGPYANLALVRPGDWISFRNLTYGEIGHSAIFVDWIDFERHSAITLEYAGENREIPGRYREYDIFKCYIVLRPAE